ncbi:MAG: site-2 protease family protein [Deltaproteobacteria bacterium]|nr:site-2 protease family protein [Deltaproteobacteria bacterium]
MILSLTVHEFAHAFTAKKLGDDTAEMMGRLTLNPLAHIDVIGTVLLPIMMLMWGGGFFFGWAKPVPVNPARFSRKTSMRTGMMITAAAGPISNLIMATLMMGLFAAAYHGGWLQGLVTTRDLMSRMVLINISLAVFNMIPVRPLDGQKVVTGLLSGNAALAWERFNMQYGTWLLIGVMVFGGRLMAMPFATVLGGLTTLFSVPMRVLF